MTTPDGTIRYEVHEHIATITLARPAKKNALTVAMYDALANALDAAATDPQVRAIVITGEGGVFTAGNDLADFMGNPPSGEDSPVFRVIEGLVALDKPLIAAVEGAAVGIGTTLLLHTDLNVLARGCALKLPFVPLGLTPEAGSSWLLPRMIGVHRATELLYLGDTLGAEEALALGIANRVVEPGEALDAAHALAARVAAQPPKAVQASKRLLRAPIRAALAPILRAEAEVLVGRLQSPEAREAFTAFFERRAPRFE